MSSIVFSSFLIEDISLVSISIRMPLLVFEAAIDDLENTIEHKFHLSINNAFPTMPKGNEVKLTSIFICEHSENGLGSCLRL